jgi:hypothetical protein
MTRLVPFRVRVRAVGLILLAAAVWSIGPARAVAESATPNQEAPPPGPDDGRYSFHRVGEGFVRLDSRTGQLAQCGWSATAWSCKMVPDERAALESEIARLQRDNAALKKSLLSRGLDLPNGVMPETSGVAVAPVPPADVPDSSSKESKGPNPPTEADIDRAFTFVKNVWRRLVDLMVDLQRDMQRKS